MADLATGKAPNPFADPTFGTENANPFSDPEFGKPSSIARRVVGDSAVSLGSGIVNLGQTAFQLGDAATGGALDKASTGLTGGIASLAAKAGDALTGSKVSQVYGAGSADDMFRPTDAQVAPRQTIASDSLGTGFNRTNDALQALYSPETQEGMQAVNDAKGFGDTAIAALTHPSSIVQSAIQSLPVSFGMMGGVRMLAERAGAAAFEKATAAGANEMAATMAKNAAITKFSEGAPGIAAQMGADFATSGAQQSGQAKDAINALPQDELERSPIYQQLVKTMSPDEAREKIAQNGQFRAFLSAGFLSALTSPISAGLEGKAATAGLRDKAAQQAARDFLGIKGIGKAIGTEGLQETLQSGGEQVGTNIGMQAVDPNYDLMKDVPNQAVAGGLSGALMGAGFHAIAHVGNANIHDDGTLTTDGGVKIDPQAGMLSAGAAAAAIHGVDQTLALPGPDTAYPGGPMITAPDGTTRPATYSDMSTQTIAAGREADGLASSRKLTEHHLQHAVDLGQTYDLATAQQIAQIYGERHRTEMAVMPTPDGQFAPIPKNWVAPSMLKAQEKIQPGPRLKALPNPDAPIDSAPMVAGVDGVRAGTDRDAQPGRARMLAARAAQVDATESAARDADLGISPRDRARLDGAPLTSTTEGEGNARNEEASQVPDAGTAVDAATGLQSDGERSIPDASTAGANDRVATGNDEAQDRNGQDAGQAGSAVGQGSAERQDALVDAAAHEAATSPRNDKPLPTPAQIEAGNYAKGHIALHGLDVSIENPAGSTRSGVSPEGKPWSNVMQHHYGYIRGTVGKDGDHIDTFIGPNPDSALAFVVDQKDPVKNRFDEHKVMLGYDSADEARAAYLAHHEKGWKGLQALTSTTVGDLKRWLANGATKSPFALQTRHHGVKTIEAAAERAKAKRGAKVESLAPAEPENRNQADSAVFPNSTPAASPAAPAERATAEKAGAGSAETAQGDRRQDTAERKRVADMTDAEKTRALLTSDLTGLGNRRAYDEAPKKATQASVDVDSLKWMNDNLGHQAGDEMLRAVGEAIARETQDGYHISGDEFVVQADTAEEANAIMARVNATLANARIEYTAPDGTVTAVTGIGISHGTGSTLQEAEVGLQVDKQRRQDAGIRAARGEEPRGVVRQAAEGRQAEDHAPAEERVVPKQKKKPVHASSLITAIARAGGIKLDLRSDILGDKSNRMIRYFGPLFRKAGMEIDELASRMHEDGFLTQQDIDDPKDNGGANKAMQMIAAELQSPNSTVTSGTEEDALFARRDAAYEDEIVRRAEELGIDTRGAPTDELVEMVAGRTIDDQFAPEELTAAGYDDLDSREQAAVDAAIDAAFGDDPQSNVDEATFMRSMGFSDEEIDDAIRETTEGGGRQQAEEPAGRFAKEGGARRGKTGQAEKVDGQVDLFGEANARDPYTKDLFEQPVARPVDSVKPASDGNVDPAGDVRGTFATRTKLIRENQRKLGVQRITSPQEAATAAAHLSGRAVEHFDAFVTDKGGRPLAIVGSFKGAIAQTSVYPNVVMAEAIRLPGAAHIWFTHNHPSGLSELSSADVRLNAAIANLFRGSGIQTHGILAVGSPIDGKSSFTHQDDNGAITRGNLSAPDPAGAAVDHVERDFEKTGKLGEAISSAQAAVREVTRIADGKTGIVVTDHQYAPIAFLPLEGKGFDKLRGTAKLRELFKGLSLANGGAAFIAQGENKLSQESIRNVGSFLKANDVNVLDVIDGGRSWADQGKSMSNPGGDFYDVDQGNGFYSALERAVADKAPFSKAGDIAAPQLRMWLAARAKDGTVKGDEIAATGIDDWLKLETGKVTKDQVQSFLANHGVKVTESMLGGDAERLPEGWRVMQSPEGLDSWHVMDADGDVVGIGDTRSDALRDAQDPDARNDGETNDGTKFGQYVLPGGENYRELLLHLPPSKPDAKAELPANWSIVTRESMDDGDGRPPEWATAPFYVLDDRTDIVGEGQTREAAIADAQRAVITPLSQRATQDALRDFRSSHYDQPNILAHVRFNDRTDADGKRVLFLEELQSDWAQKGKKEGFVPSAAETKRIADEYDAAAAAVTEAHNSGDAKALVLARARMAVATADYNERINDAKIPAGPFVGKTEAWVSLALKRMIRYAAENGYDRVAFTNGEQQAARYDLSKRIESVEYRVQTGKNEGALTAYDHAGERVMHEIVPTDKVDDYIGKDAAAKLMDSPGPGIANWDGKVYALAGEDLKVGGEGMKAFYDKIVPNVANDVLKKLGGGRVDQTPINVGENVGKPEDDGAGGVVQRTQATASPQPGFDITPKLRDTVMQGIPLFDRSAAPAPTATMTPADQAVARVAAAGGTAQTLLADLAKNGSTLYDRIVAKALLATGVDSKITYGTSEGMRFQYKDAKMAAAYRPSTDTVTFFGQKDLEKHAIHELTHAATVKAIRAGGTASVELDRLFAQVKASGAIDQSLYGLRDRYEFVAEAFSNPKFQEALRGVEVTPGSSRSLWDGFVNLVRRVLGLKSGTALDEAMRIGANLMQEDKALRAAPVSGGTLGDAATPVITDTQAFKNWFGQSKVVDARGEPLTVFHGAPDARGLNEDGVFRTMDERMLKFGATPESSARAMAQRGYFFTSSKATANTYADDHRAFDYQNAEPETIPAYLSLQNPMIVEARGKHWRDVQQGIDKQSFIAAAKAAGHDGVIIRNVRDNYNSMDTGRDPASTVYVAFKPEQIKHATRNSGEFDSSNPSMFADLSDPAHADVLGNVVQDVRQKFADTMKTQKTLSWWHKTVGTMYHVAETVPAFKPVFDIGQRFVQDVSRIAMSASDMAPSFLPKLGSLADVLKKGISKADGNAVAKAVFQGTREGERYTDDVLRDRFKMTPKQVALFAEARNSIDRMLDETMTSEIARIGRKALSSDTIEAMRKDPGNAARIALDALKGDTSDLGQQIQEKAEQMQKLKDEGYAPLSRFGQHTVYAVDENGKQLFYDMKESQAAANALARALKEEYPNATVTQGILSQSAFRAFEGTNPDSLELFAQAMGLDEDEVFQQYIRQAVNNRSTLKRLAHRATGADGLSGLEGYSEDLPRVLAAFITSSGRMAAKNYSAVEMREAVAAIPKEQGDVVDLAEGLRDYIMNPQDNEAPALRGWLFTHFIGGSVASAITNMTQPVLQTLPKLAQFAGVTRASAELAKASMMAATGQRGDAKMQALLKRAEDDGVLAPHEVHQLYAESMRGFGSNPYFRKFIKVWGSFFAVAEAFNRKATFIAAHAIGETMTPEALASAGVKDAFGFAEKMIGDTQGIYNKGNRPVWSRGAVGATLFTFKQFSISYLEFIKRLPLKQQALALGILVMAAGAQGLPFAEDLEDIIDTIGQSLGYDTNSKEKLRQTAAAILGENVGGFVMNGFSNLPGVPIDVQGRLGLSNLIPGTSILKRSEKDKLKDAFEVIGPLGAFVNSLTGAVSQAQQGNWKGIATGALPVAVQNAIKGVDMAQTGFYRNAKGANVVATNGMDAFVKGIGFTPEKVADAREVTSDVMQDTQLNQIVTGQLINRWAQGIVQNDLSKVNEAVAAWRQWNIDNPNSMIKISLPAVQQAAKQMMLTEDIRTIKSAPASMRGAIANQEFQRARP